MRRTAAAGDEAASAAILSAFTPEGIRAVLPRLTRVYPITQVAVSQAPNVELATMPLGRPDPTRAWEREAERIAASLISPGAPLGRRASRRILSRLLDTNAVREAEQAVQPAVPAIAAGATAAAAAAATAPLWVWVVLAVVVVVALVAVAYWVFSDDTPAEPAPAPQPQPAPAPLPQPAPAPAPLPQPAPGPSPRPVPRDCVEQAERLSQGDCRFEAHVLAPSDRNPQADEYCEDITNSPCEFWLYSPNGGGALAKFDGIRGTSALECKCGYDHFLDDLESETPWRRRVAQDVLDKMLKQILSHSRYTQDGGLQYRVFVSSGRLAEWLRDQLGPGQVDIILQPSELCD